MARNNEWKPYNPTDNRLKAYIAISNSNKVYMYNSMSDVTLVDSARDKTKEWDGWEHFNQSLIAKEMVTLTIQLGIHIRFKTGSKEDLSLEVWEELCRIADDRRGANKQVATRNSLTGKVEKKRGRRSVDSSSRRYVMKVHGNKKKLMEECPCRTRQARKIWEFIVDECIATGLPYIVESRMQNIVNDRAQELNTKQNPWRIFQYYRPELIDCQLIKLEK